MKKVLVQTVSVLLLTSLFTACGNSGRKTLHCDNCGKEIYADADSDFNEVWMIYCPECEKDLGLDNVIPKR